MAEAPRVPGRYVVYFIIAFAIFCAVFGVWGIRKMRDAEIHYPSLKDGYERGKK